MDAAAVNGNCRFREQRRFARREPPIRGGAMDMENCAPGAPRRGFAYSPTGFRRLTPSLLKVDRTAEGFSGLPDGVTVHRQLLAAFKGAGPRLGLPTRVVHAV